MNQVCVHCKMPESPSHLLTEEDNEFGGVFTFNRNCADKARRCVFCRSDETTADRPMHYAWDTERDPLNGLALRFGFHGDCGELTLTTHLGKDYAKTHASEHVRTILRLLGETIRIRDILAEFRACKSRAGVSR